MLVLALLLLKAEDETRCYLCHCHEHKLQFLTEKDNPYRVNQNVFSDSKLIEVIGWFLFPFNPYCL